MYVIRSDQTIFHEEEHVTPTAEESFCYDDHNYAVVTIDADCSENPYSTRNIQDILRSHRYSYTQFGDEGERDDSTAGDPSTLPPLKLPNMNVYVDMMVERAVASKEVAMEKRRFVAEHPSLFQWDSLTEIQLTSTRGTLSRAITETNEMVDSESDEGELDNGDKIIGDAYLDMQIIQVWVRERRMSGRFARSKAIVAQFLTRYISYIRSVCNERKELICWDAIPGMFLFDRFFLLFFQDFYMSKLSSGILRMNLHIDRVMRDSVAYAMW